MRNRRNFIKSIGGGMTVAGLLGIELGEDRSLNEYINRHSARFVLNPRKYLKPESTENLDIFNFNNLFTYQTDQMMGMYDTVQDVEETISFKRGDCVDYTAVAASWILQHKNVSPVLLLYVPEDPSLMGHINVTDGSTLYDNGNAYSVANGQYDLQDYDLVYKKEV